MTVLIIGGGAAGMTAAVAAARPGVKVIIAERQSRVGRKLSVTGNGRCNLTNMNISARNYHGGTEFAMGTIGSFGPDDALRFFEELGLMTVTEKSGKVYPFSDSANSVVDVLRFGCDAAGVETRTGVCVKSLNKNGNGFRAVTDSGVIDADKVIIACGGMAGGKAGGVRDGYELLKSFGHVITPLYPSLVQLKSRNALCRSLKGVRAQAVVSLSVKGGESATGSGEVQFTEYGLSGPAIFEVSRDAARGGCEISLDLFPEIPEEKVVTMLIKRRENMPDAAASELMTGLLHNRLGRVMLKYAGIAESILMKNLTDNDIMRIAAGSKDFRHEISGSTGFDNAQVTAGGADVAGFDPVTMESRLVKGLYAAGEVLDVDGDCGGYNLQWAWASGYAAGKAASR